MVEAIESKLTVSLKIDQKPERVSAMGAALVTSEEDKGRGST